METVNKKTAKKGTEAVRARGVSADRMDKEAAQEETEVLVRATKPLLAWFEKEKRDLPWRKEPTAYRVWVSEIMLQQTRVEAVKPYYERFLAELPDVRALAEVDETRLFKLWEGLGYYNRVRNMQKAARIMTKQYEGAMPRAYEQVLALPGIGSYTAGAICSIAYGTCVPAVDGNVLRVISRVLGKDWDIAKQQTKQEAELLLQEVMQRIGKKEASEHAGKAEAKEAAERAENTGVKDAVKHIVIGEQNENDAERIRNHFAGDFNQALMELGACVCVPNGIAKCEQCPLRGMCAAYCHGRVLELPYKSAKKPRRIERMTVFLLQGQDSVVLRRRPQKGLLAGLYEFPNVSGYLSEEEALAFVKAQAFSAVRIRTLPEAKHIFTHVEWHMHGFLVTLEETHGLPQGEWIYAKKTEVETQYAIPSAFAVYRSYCEKL